MDEKRVGCLDDKRGRLQDDVGVGGCAGEMMRDFDSVFSLEFVCLDIECLVVLDGRG